MKSGRKVSISSLMVRNALNTRARCALCAVIPASFPHSARMGSGQLAGNDAGITAHKAHRARVFSAFRTIRDEIDTFKPDFILMWGDDQYENFKEDIIPPYCVLAYDQLEFRPYKRLRGRPNIWGEPED